MLPISDAEQVALRVFADTCVLFAAVHGYGRTGEGHRPGASLTIFQLGQAKVVDLVVSAQVLVEARRVLQSKLAGAMPLLDSFVGLSTTTVADADAATLSRAGECVGDAADAPILAAAASSGCRFLVTLNPRHFPTEFAGVAVVEPGGLVTIVRRHLLGLQWL
ncbi:MAG: PIN domain-containing protein [Anaerolineae bacterium]